MQQFTRPLAWLLFMALILSANTPVGAQQDKSEVKPPRLFSSNEMLEVTLKGPWRSIRRDSANPKRYAGSIEFTDSDDRRHAVPLGVTTRGLSRRDRVCDFPPLKLWFDKPSVKGTSFRGQGSLKLVTHCQSNTRFQQYYVKEYLAYRVYNLITPFSFRVRPLMITYQDSERDDKEVRRFGFLIEDIDDVAKRHDLKELEVPEVSRLRLDAVEASNYALFQYLIGNLDWSAISGPDPEECCHNSKLIGGASDSDPVYAIPYDFDSSGLVDAHYAAPPSNLGMRNVRQRLFRGFCNHNDTLPAAIDRVLTLREAIADLFRNESLLSSKHRNAALRYIDRFYADLGNPDSVEEKITGRCRD